MNNNVTNQKTHTYSIKKSNKFYPLSQKIYSLTPANLCEF